MWAARVRAYRNRTGLSQERLAEMFGVDVRTVRRWEAGATRPTASVRKRLEIAPVPIMQNPSVTGFAQIVRAATGFVSLLDENHALLAWSESFRTRMERANGPGWREMSHLERIKSPAQEIITATCEKHGGLDKMMRAGLSALTHDFQYEYHGKPISMRFTSARLFVNSTESVLLHTSFGIAPDQAQPGDPLITYFDEIVVCE